MSVVQPLDGQALPALTAGEAGLFASKFCGDPPRVLFYTSELTICWHFRQYVFFSYANYYPHRRDDWTFR